MDNISSVVWVMCAGAAAWAGIGLYLFFLSRKQSAISRRIRRLEEIMGEDE